MYFHIFEEKIKNALSYIFYKIILNVVFLLLFRLTIKEYNTMFSMYNNK